MRELDEPPPAPRAGAVRKADTSEARSCHGGEATASYSKAFRAARFGRARRYVCRRSASRGAAFSLW